MKVMKEGVKGERESLEEAEDAQEEVAFERNAAWRGNTNQLVIKESPLEGFQGCGDGRARKERRRKRRRVDFGGRYRAKAVGRLL